MVHRYTEPHNRDEYDGQVLILAAIASVVLLGFVAMAVDVGMLLAERRGVQNAADAAALAVARGMVNPDADLNELVETAQEYAAANGYGDNVVVSVNFDDEEVTIDLTHEVDRIFLGAFYDGDWTVSAHAMANLTAVQEPFALIALGEDPNCHPSTGIRFSGSSSLNIEGGSVGSNSCVRVDGSSLDALIDGNVEALHGIDDSHDRLQLTEGHRKKGLGRPIDDPFDHVDAPTCSENGEATPDPHAPGSHILTPGRYASFPSGGNVDYVSLLPGIYCIQDRVTVGSNVTVRSVDPSYLDDGSVGSGGGVLLYAGGTKGEIRFNGQGNMQIRALSYIDPSFSGCTNACEENIAVWVGESACTDFDASGGSSTTIHGVIYAPCSTVELGGNPTANVLEGMIVADAVHLHGDVSMNLIANQDPIDMPPRVYLIQ